MRLPNTSLILPCILLFADLLVLECAFLFVYWGRFLSGWFAVPKGVPDLGVYLAGSAGVLGVFVGICYARGMYDLRRRPGLSDDVAGLLRCVLEATLLLAAAGFFYRGYSFSRSFLASFAACSYTFLLVGRLFARYLQRIARTMGVGVERVALLGRGPCSRAWLRRCEDGRDSATRSWAKCCARATSRASCWSWVQCRTWQRSSSSTAWTSCS
jgi:FlaA1/EpsC-like NDP-sugar epimerase